VCRHLANNTLGLERVLALLGLHQLLALLVGFESLLVLDWIELLHQQLLECKDRVGRAHKDLGGSLFELGWVDAFGILSYPIDKLRDRLLIKHTQRERERERESM
jgi:hypothetical protein